jgi:SNF2-related domain
MLVTLNATPGVGWLPLTLCSCSGYEYFPEDSQDDVPVWDLAILDEGHKVKNFNSKSYKAVQGLSARVRIVVTGTPMQNNLMEMHALLDLACPGLLPERKAFKIEANIIESGQVLLLLHVPDVLGVVFSLVSFWDTCTYDRDLHTVRQRCTHEHFD